MRLIFFFTLTPPPSPTSIALHISPPAAGWLLIDIFPGRLYMPACFVLHPNFFFFLLRHLFFSRRYIFSFKLEWEKRADGAHAPHWPPFDFNDKSHSNELNIENWG
jgi:hypothetical protein